MLRIFVLIFTLIAVGLCVKSCSQENHKEKVYIIGRDENFSSMQFMGKETGLLAFADDLFISFSISEGYRVQTAKVSSIDLIPSLEIGKFDLIISVMPPTPINTKKFTFSEPFFLIGPVLVIPKDVEVSSLEEMENTVVGIQSGASVLFNIERYPDVVFRSYENIWMALDDVVSGKIDGVIMGDIAAYVYTSNIYNNTLKIATAPLNNSGLRLVSMKNAGGGRFIEDFNNYLKKIKQDGSYDAMLKKWGLFNPEIVNP